MSNKIHNMSLTPLDRMAVLFLLPARSNVETLRPLKNLKTVLKLSDAEEEAIDYKAIPNPMGGGDTISYDREKAQDDALLKDVSFCEVAHGVVCKRLKEMNRDEQLSEDHIPVWEKFMEKPDKVEEAPKEETDGAKKEG